MPPRSVRITVGDTVHLNPKIKTPAALLVAPLAVSMLLAGCGAGSKPAASGSSTTASSRTPSAAPKTTSAAPTATASHATDPNIPAAAQAHTPAGAEAFVRYFYSQLNTAWSRPQAGLISRLSEASCKTCSNLEREAAKSVARHERVIGQSIILATVDTSDASDPAKMTVLAIGYQPKTIVVDAKGKTVQSLKRERVRTVVSVHWASPGWVLSEIQSVA
jgi:predicted lipid-binding transport protein (Tim44 family)